MAAIKSLSLGAVCPSPLTAQPGTMVRAAAPVAAVFTKSRLVIALFPVEFFCEIPMVILFSGLMLLVAGCLVMNAEC
jgi:hypothetical protein